MAQHSNFIVRGGMDYSNITKGINVVQKQLGSFEKKIGASVKVIGTALGGIAVGELIKSTTQMAMSVESSMDNIRRNMGAANQAFQYWVDTQSKSLGMAKADAEKYGSTFSNLIGSFTDSAEETAKSTEDLMKSASIIASKTGRTYDDVSERIRSGMLGSTEAIEDLGVYTQVSMIESTEAFKKFSNGKSWNQLNYKTQQQIRLASILEQTYARYGNTLANTTQTKQARFLATLKNIELNLGKAFLPIYNSVLPALNSLAASVEAVTSTLSQMSEALFGKALITTTDNTIKQTEAMTDLGDATEAAGNQAKKAFASFDEGTVINKNSTSSGGASTGTGGGNTSTPSGSTDTTGGIVKSFEGIKNAIAPTINALGRLRDAISPLTAFVFDNLSSFYHDFLAPIGKWALGDGIPTLLDTLSGLLNGISWDTLNDALKNLYKALAPFAIGVGKGLVDFISVLTEILTPMVNSMVEGFSSAINGLAKAIGLIPEDAAISLGGAIGGLVTAFLAFKGTEAVISAIKDIRKSFSTLLTAIQANPVLAIATAIGALAGAVLALDKAKFDASSIGQYIKKVDELVNSSKKLNKEIEETLDNQEERKNGIEAEYGAVGILADKYFGLADKESLTNEEQALLKAYAQDLIDKIPKLSDLIDEQTGAYKGTKEQIEALINKTKEYYLVQAAQESLTEIARAQYQAEMDLKNLENQRKDVADKLKASQDALNVALEAATKDTVSQKEAAYQAFLVHQQYDETINALDDSLSDIDKQISDTTSTQQKLNTQWDYATDYISEYSSTTSTEMPKVESAVDSALASIGTKVKQFKLPPIKIGVEAEVTSVNYESNGYAWQSAPVQKKANGGFVTNRYAVGGLPNMGDLFVANESGPELVGHIGSRTAVANTDQIVEAVSIGVANAVSAVMGSGRSGASGDVVLMVDGEEIARVINKGGKQMSGRYSPIVMPV